MLNRRILRIKAFKILYSVEENQGLTLKEALAGLDASAEATRDLYLYMLGVIPALTEVASKRIDAAKGKFNPTEEDLNPNLKFVHNSLVPIIAEDPQYLRLCKEKKFSWEQNDAYLDALYTRLSGAAYFKKYMDSGKSSPVEDASIWAEIFTREFEEDAALEEILQDHSIHWADDLSYVLSICIRQFKDIAKKGVWEYPPLYRSDILKAQGKPADSDSDFVHRLLTTAVGKLDTYKEQISASVSKWDLDRLCATDIALVALGLAEIETFPEIPTNVSINEYVEIAKYYSTPRSSSFVNGLLDHLVKQSNK